MKIPTVVTIHSRFARLLPWWRYAFSTEFSVRHARRVIAVSAEASGDLHRVVQPGKLRVIRNGVDVERFRAGEGDSLRAELGIRDEPLILSVGRICRAKNQLAAIDVFERLQNLVPDAHLVFMGPPSEQDYFERLLESRARSSLQHRIHIVPGVSPVSQTLVNAYHSSDVVILTSLWESFPVVVPEAWAAGRPVVGTDAGGLGEILRGTGGGIAVPGERLLEEMPAALHQVLRDARVAAELVEAGQEALEELSWDYIAGETAQLYREVLT